MFAIKHFIKQDSPVVVHMRRRAYVAAVHSLVCTYTLYITCNKKRRVLPSSLSPLRPLCFEQTQIHLLLYVVVVVVVVDDDVFLSDSSLYEIDTLGAIEALGIHR